MWINRGLGVRAPRSAAPTSTPLMDVGTSVRPRGRRHGRQPIIRPAIVSPDVPAEQLISAGRTDELYEQIQAIKANYE